MAIRNPKPVSKQKRQSEQIQSMTAGANDAYIRKNVTGEEFDTYTPTQKMMARDVFEEASKYFDYSMYKGKARDFIADGPMVGSDNPYKGETFSPKQMGAVIREALPLYHSPDTIAEGVKSRKLDPTQKLGRYLEMTEGIDEQKTFDAFGFAQPLKPVDILEGGRGLPSLKERLDNRYRPADAFTTDIIPDSRKLNEGGMISPTMPDYMFGIGDMPLISASSTDDTEETTPYQNFFVSQQVYSPEEYAAGPVNFFQGALGNPVDVDTDDEDEDEDETEVDAEALAEAVKVEDPTEKPAIPATKYTLGQGRGPSFEVTSYAAGDFDINYTDYAKASYGTDKTDNFVKDAMKDMGLGIQADFKTEAALAPITAADASGMLGTTAGLAFSKSVPAPFGKDTSTRPAGLTGIGFDLAMSFHAKNAAAVKLAGGKAGALMVVNNMLVSRKPGDMRYTGNLGGLTQQQMAGIEATKSGFIAGTLRDEKDDKGNIVTTGMKGLMDAETAFKVGGNVSETGYFISIYGGGAPLTGRAGLKNKEFAAAYEAARRQYGVTQNQFIAALQEAQSKTGAFGTVRGKYRNVTYLSDALKRMQGETQEALKAQKAQEALQVEREKDAAFERGQVARDRMMDRLMSENDPQETSPTEYSMGDFADDYAASYEGVDDFDFKEGGRVGLALGGQPPDAPAGFVEGKPEEFTDKEKVADDKPMAVSEGTFVINAAAVEMAGSEDIKQMLLKAYEIANQREGMNVDRPIYEEAVNVAVSRGEVIVPPQLARVIGYDRLEKINNRGKKETRKRIEETQAAAEGGFIGMNQGGFIDYVRGLFGGGKDPEVKSPNLTNPSSEPAKAAEPSEGFASPPPPAQPSTPMAPATEFEELTTDLLQRLEDNKFEGYIPKSRNDSSGVTIGRGFDLGQHSPTDLVNMGLDTALISRFTPYLKKTGQAARDALAYEKSQGRGLKFTKAEEGILEDLNLTVQRAKYAEFERIMGKLKLPMPHNDASRAAVFSEFYHGSFTTNQTKDGGLKLKARKSFMEELMNTGSVYSAFQEGIVNKTREGSGTRNRAEETMRWLKENGGMVHAFDKLVPGDDAHYIDTRTGERLPPTPPVPTPPPPRPKKKNTGMMALPVPPPKNRSATR